MTTPFSAMVVGCGRVGSGYDEARESRPPLTHAGAYAAHPRIELIGGVDSNPDARARFEHRWGVPAYASLKAALAGGPDLVSIATPPRDRRAVVEQILEARPRAIWIEKPLAATAVEGEWIVDACQRAGVALQVNFDRRFDPVHRRLAETIQSDDGTLHMHFCFSGTLENFGSHALDLFRWFAGEPAELHVTSLHDRDPEILLVTQAGCTGSFMRVRTADTTVFDFLVLTVQRRLLVGALGAEVIEARVAGSRVVDGIKLHHFCRDIDRTGAVGAMLAGADGLARHLDDGEEIMCTGHDGLAALRLHEAIVAATLSGETEGPSL